MSRKHDRRDTAHHDRELRVEPHDDREDERRAEHRDDVLRTQPDGPAPGQPLVGPDDVVRAGDAAVAVKLPTDCHAAPPRALTKQLRAVGDLTRPPQGDGGARMIMT